MNEFHFFWGGPFSQWHPSQFEVGGVKYNCTEQYMMSKKAELFVDRKAQLKIMAYSDPRMQKAIGKTVKGFVVDQWNAVAKDIVFRGNMAKFTQNSDLKGYMLATGDQEIVEASPQDVIWGIGLSADDPDAHDKTKWKGTNWLGEVLMDVRDSINMTSVKECLVGKASAKYNPWFSPYCPPSGTPKEDSERWHADIMKRNKDYLECIDDIDSLLEKLL